MCTAPYKLAGAGAPGFTEFSQATGRMTEEARHRGGGVSLASG